jgi:putative flippase GtrA
VSPVAEAVAGARWFKFYLVGAIGIVVQFASLALLAGVLHINYLVATALSVEAAVIHNFLWHERFTWADRPSHGLLTSLRRLAHFNLTTGAISLLGNLLLMRLLVGQAHLPLLLANALSIASCSVLNYLVSDRWVFLPRAEK